MIHQYLEQHGILVYDPPVFETT